jgi:hypothetical protein
MKLTSKPLAALIVVLLFGGISFSAGLGWWQTETNRIPAKFSEGELAGEYNPADIRGSYNFGDVSTLFNIPIEDLQRAFRLPENPAAVALKDLEALYTGEAVEIGTASVRLFTAWYRGLPYEPTEDTYLFAEAVDILISRETLTEDQLAYLQAHTAPQVPLSQEQPAVQTTLPASTPQPTIEATLHAPEAGKVGGKTTIQNLVDWGVSNETLESILGSPLPPSQTIIKDYCNQKGLTFSEVKTQLQTEVDKLP